MDGAEKRLSNLAVHLRRKLSIMSEVRTRSADEISRERPRIIVRIRTNRLGAKFCRQLWKDRVEKVSCRSQTRMDSDNGHIRYSKCEETVRNDAGSDNSTRNCGRNDGCDAIDTVSSRATHYKKTIIEKHRRIARRWSKSLGDFVDKEGFDSDRFDDDQGIFFFYFLLFPFFQSEYLKIYKFPNW